MDEKENGNNGNFYTMMGGALLGMGIVDQITKNIIPEVQKIITGKIPQELKALPVGNEKPEEREKPEREEERKPQDNEVAELKRKLAEYETKEKGQHK